MIFSRLHLCLRGVCCVAWLPLTVVFCLACFAGLPGAGRTQGGKKPEENRDSRIALVTYAVAFAADSSTVMSVTSDNRLRVWNVETGQLQRTLELSATRLRAAAFSPDGAFLAVTSDGDQNISLWNVKTGTVERTLALTRQLGDKLAFSADGRQLVCVGLSSYGRDAPPASVITLWDTTSGALLQRIEPGMFVQDVSLSAQADCLAVAGIRYSPRRARAAQPSCFDLIEVASGKLLRSLLGDSGGVTAVAFSPDGRQLAGGISQGNLRIWNARTGDTLRTWQGEGAHYLTFSPDGKWLVNCTLRASVKIWNAQTGALRQTLLSPYASPVSPAFSADGKWIASAGYDDRLALWNNKTGKFVRVIRFAR